MEYNMHITYLSDRFNMIYGGDIIMYIELQHINKSFGDFKASDDELPWKKKKEA